MTVIARKSPWLIVLIPLSILGPHKLDPMILLQQHCSRPASIAVSAQLEGTVEDKTPATSTTQHGRTYWTVEQPHSQDSSNPSRAVFSTFGEICCTVEVPAAAESVAATSKDAQVAPWWTRARGTLHVLEMSTPSLLPPPHAHVFFSSHFLRFE